MKHYFSHQLYLKYICKIPGFNVNVLNQHNIVWLGIKPDPLFCNLIQIEDSELFHVEILIFQDGHVPIIVQGSHRTTTSGRMLNKIPGLENVMFLSGKKIREFQNEAKNQGTLSSCMSIVIVYVLFNIMFDHLF